MEFVELKNSHFWATTNCMCSKTPWNLYLRLHQFAWNKLNRNDQHPQHLQDV